MFNLVYETNVASCRIWDALGFKRLGRIKACGNLKSYPGELVDAIIYGRDLGQEDDFVSEERFDKIRYYLKNGKYPNGADRAEKSRLRSAATHYKLLPPNGTDGERLMLKGKEVISDPQRQYEIARELHHKSHGGINKTTASIAELYHWVRIKETVSQVIRNCAECSELNKGMTAARSQSRFGQPSLPPLPPSAPSNAPDAARGLQPAQQSQLQRPDSPNNQLQLEAAHHFAAGFPPQHHEYDMPLDPALIEGVHHPLSLEDLPPSPFLSAAQHLPAPLVPHAAAVGPPESEEPKSVLQEADDTLMLDSDEHVSAPENLRRRLRRAGYRQMDP